MHSTFLTYTVYIFVSISNYSTCELSYIPVPTNSNYKTRACATIHKVFINIFNRVCIHTLLLYLDLHKGGP